MATIKLYRGDTWRHTWLLSDEREAPIDLTGATARLQVRDGYDTAVITATVANDRLVIDPAAGRIDLDVHYAITEALTPGSYRWDLEITTADDRRLTIDGGALVVLPDMTR